VNAFRSVLLVVCSSLLFPMLSEAQCTNFQGSCGQPVPHLLKFQQVLRDSVGTPYTGVIAVRFSIYANSEGGSPLWQETQNVDADRQGHFEVVLGSSTSQGMPLDLFPPGESRWIGLQPLLPGAQETGRVLMVSVPYALQAGNAETLGGLPASAFAKASSAALIEGSSAVTATGTPSASSSPSTVPPNPNPISGSGAINTIPKFSATQSILDSQIVDASGMVTMRNLSNILFADRFPGGVPDAVAACPANGCIIYATAPSVNLNLGTIDPGSKAITLYLGPYNYTVKQITLRKALKIIGMGASGGNTAPVCTVAAPCNGTAMQSINGNNPVFVLPQTTNSAATNVLLSGFRLYGSPGNTNEDGFFLDTSTTLNAGLWYSTLDDVYLQGFAGIGIHIKGRNNDFGSMCQWVLFNNVVVWRARGGGNGLRLEGAAFELRFRNCEFDGQALGDGTNIYLGGLAGGLSGYPLSIAFEGLITQQAATGVVIDGATHVTFYESHHENLWGAYQINDSFGIWTQALTITDSYFAGNVGSNAGSGYLLNVATTVAKGISFAHNSIFGAPDSVVKGTNLSSVAYQDNLYQPVVYWAPNPAPFNVPTTSGITTHLAPTTVINIQGAHSVGLNPSSMPIATIQSTLGPGEMVTFFTLAGAVTFSSAGNIGLMGLPSVQVSGSITFIRSDLGASQWIPVAQWSPQHSSSQGISNRPGPGPRQFKPSVYENDGVFGRPLPRP
jgi:hypothetical protein